MKHALKDSLLILLSIFFAILITEANLIERFLSLSENIRLAGSFIAGLFFTSIFTTAPAIVVLGKISLFEPVLIVAFIGAIGAMFGDIILFYLFKNHVSDDLNELAKKIKHNPLKTTLGNKNFRWLGMIVGALIIASPFPDELGIAVMGISKLNTKFFVLISFTFNFIGILAIGYASRLIG